MTSAFNTIFAATSWEAASFFSIMSPISSPVTLEIPASPPQGRIRTGGGAQIVNAGTWDDQTVGGHPVVVLSYDYWRNRFELNPVY